MMNNVSVHRPCLESTKVIRNHLFRVAMSALGGLNLRPMASWLAWLSTIWNMADDDSCWCW